MCKIVLEVVDGKGMVFFTGSRVPPERGSRASEPHQIYRIFFVGFFKYLIVYLCTTTKIVINYIVV